MTPLQRKTTELEAKLRSMPSELDVWLGLSELGKPFEKHHSQIRRLSLQMRLLHDKVVGEYAKAVKDATLLDVAVSLEKRSLAIHTVWDFFRAKFALRAVEPLGSYLKMADAFARECYDPVRAQFVAAGGADRREPPLVTFDNRVSPWALARDGRYAPASDPGGIIATSAFSEVVSKLPIPLLGLPWHYLSYLPHVVFLAHECGHAVEKDFGLNPSTQDALNASGIDAKRLPAWQAWQREVFADVFACYTAGPAYPAALAEVLASDQSRVEAEVKPGSTGWGNYPTTSLRMLLNIETIKVLGFDQDAARLRDQWTFDYPAHAMTTFEDDLPVIAKAMLGGAALPQNGLRFTAADRAQSMTTADLYRANGRHQPTDVYPVRVLIAAAQELQNPPALAPQALDKHWAALCMHAVKSRPPGLLGADKQRASLLDADHERAQADVIGDVLFGGIDDDID